MYSTSRDFDLLSVRSEALCSNANFTGSTPLNVSFDLGETVPPIDFYSYKIRSFEMCIGQALSDIEMTGYIVNSANDVRHYFFILLNK